MSTYIHTDGRKPHGWPGRRCCVGMLLLCRDPSLRSRFHLSSAFLQTAMPNNAHGGDIAAGDSHSAGPASANVSDGIIPLDATMQETSSVPATTDNVERISTRKPRPKLTIDHLRVPKAGLKISPRETLLCRIRILDWKISTSIFNALLHPACATLDTRATI